MYSNVDSLANKREEFKIRINEIKPHIIGLTETLPKNQKYSFSLKKECSLPNYDVFTNDKEKRGVALYLHKTLQAQECPILNKSDFEESVWCKFKSAYDQQVLVGCLYKSPNTTEENVDRLFNLLKNHNELSSFDKVLILGDFNYPNIQWDGTWTGPHDNKFIECLRDAFLLQKVTKPTRNRENQKPSIVDLV